MTGKNDLRNIYNDQVKFQQEISNLELPKDDIYWHSYHVQGLIEEIGEVLTADKRWKTHRNNHYDPSNKLQELADVFITVMNLSIYSGFTADDLLNAISSKIEENKIKFESIKGE